MIKHLDDAYEYMMELYRMEPEALKDEFATYEMRGNLIVFHSRFDDKEEINVRQHKTEHSFAFVNANLCDEKSMASNNYTELIPIAEKLVDAYKIPKTQYMSDVFEWARKKIREDEEFL